MMKSGDGRHRDWWHVMPDHVIADSCAPHARVMADSCAPHARIPWGTRNWAQDNKFLSATLDVNQDLNISWLEVYMYVYKNMGSILDFFIVVLLVSAGVVVRPHALRLCWSCRSPCARRTGAASGRECSRTTQIC